MVHRTRCSYSLALRAAVAFIAFCRLHNLQRALVLHFLFTLTSERWRNAKTFCFSSTIALQVLSLRAKNQHMNLCPQAAVASLDVAAPERSLHELVEWELCALTSKNIRGASSAAHVRRPDKVRGLGSQALTRFANFELPRNLFVPWTSGLLSRLVPRGRYEGDHLALRSNRFPLLCIDSADGAVAQSPRRPALCASADHLIVAGAARSAFGT